MKISTFVDSVTIHRPQRHHHRQTAVQPLHRRGERRRQTSGHWARTCWRYSPGQNFQSSALLAALKNRRRHLPPAGDRLEPSGQEVRDQQQPDHPPSSAGDSLSASVQLSRDVTNMGCSGGLSSVPVRKAPRPPPPALATRWEDIVGQSPEMSGGAPPHPAHCQQQLLCAGLR